MDLNFKCPDCQRDDDVLQIVRRNCATYTEVTGINEEGFLEYRRDPEDVDAGYVYGYQCESCGYPLKNTAGKRLTKQYEVINWLNNQRKDNSDVSI